LADGWMDADGVARRESSGNGSLTRSSGLPVCYTDLDFFSAVKVLADTACCVGMGKVKMYYFMILTMTYSNY
jgi:hypothetical protein